MASHAMLKMIENASGAELRQSFRHRVLLSAKLVTTTDERPIRLRELSATGALLEGTNLPPPGGDVLIQRGSVEMFGTIIWSEDNRAGIDFEGPLSEDQLRAQIRPAAQAVLFQPAAKRAALTTSSSLTCEQRELAAEWGNPQGRAALRD